MAEGWREIRGRAVEGTGAGPEDLYVALRHGVGDDADAWCCPVSIGPEMSAAEYALRRHLEQRETEGRLL